MAKLLDEIIAARKAKAVAYEDYLKQIAELAKRVQAGKGDDMPEQLDTPGRRALFNNLGRNKELALQVDDVVKSVRHDGWRGVQAREQVIKSALYGVLHEDVDEVERIFSIIKAQPEY